MAYTNDWDSSRSITFIVQEPPSLGNLYIVDQSGILTPTSNFTQKHINESKVIFEHTKPLSQLSTQDTFTFDIRTPFAEPLEDVKFLIDISVSGAGGNELGRYLQLKPLKVKEGGSVALKIDNLNISAVSEYLSKYPGAAKHPKLISRFVRLPRHGVLTIKNDNITEPTKFNSHEIKYNLVHYYHDDSDTRHDEIGISIHLETSIESQPLLLFNGSLNVTVSPVNDQPFRLVTKEPHITVVRRQAAVISREHLLTTDPDNQPQEILYEIMSGPDHGKLVLAHNYSISVHAFTQRDVDQKRLLYVHDGSNSSAEFFFQVSDGVHPAEYTNFIVDVEPLTLSLLNHSTVYLQQASTVTYIRSQNLAAISNGNPAHIFYNVTLPPRYGSIYVDDRPILNFGQVNIDKGQVIYLQTDLSATSDSFSVTIWTFDQVLRNVEIRIVVQPLIEVNPLYALVGSRTRLTLRHLNASRLAAVTGSIPRYTIKRAPRLGRVKKVLRRSRRSGRSYEVKEFTHEDLRAGHIFFVARKLRLIPGEPLHDTLHYTLIVPAPGVQPADGALNIEISSTIIEDSTARTEETEGPPRELRPDLPPSERGPIYPSPSDSPFGLTKEHLLVAAAGAVAIVIILTIIISARCIAGNRRQRRNEEQSGKLDVDVGSLPPPACTDSRPNSFMTDDMSEIDAPTLAHTHTTTSPRPTRHMIHSNSNGVGSGNLGLAAHLSDSEASWPREASREVSPAVPQCKVTPLCPEPSCQTPCQTPCQSPHSGYPYGADPDQVEEWSLYESQAPRTTNPMLRKNQYWV